MKFISVFLLSCITLQGIKYKSFPKPPELTLHRRGKGDDYNISGEIEVGVDYNGKDLVVRIVKASNIAGVYQDGAQSDPYVQLYLLPDKESMKKSKTQKRTLNPIYNETFIVSTRYILLYKPQSFYPHLH